MHSMQTEMSRFRADEARSRFEAGPRSNRADLLLADTGLDRGVTQRALRRPVGEPGLEGPWRLWVRSIALDGLC